MFKVMVEQEWTTLDKLGEYQTVTRQFEFISRTEKVFELIGRFFVKYGIPNDHKTDNGSHLIEFYKETKDDGYIAASVYFERTNVKNIKEAKTVVEVKKENELIESMVASGAISKR